MSKLINVKKSDLPSLVTAESKKNFFKGIEELSASVAAIEKAGECFAQIPDNEWKVCKGRLPGEAKRWAQNARDVVKKGLHPAFALMAGELGRKARKLPPSEQARILKEPIEVAILSDNGRIADKEMRMASELNSNELNQVIVEDRAKAWVAEPREQAARARAKAKALENKKESQANFVIEKRNYSVDREGVKLKKKTLSFGQFQELYEDVEKVRKELK